MIELGILADDLTGGMMVASLLEREGIECPLVCSTSGLPAVNVSSAQAVVLARKIRLIEADSAAQEASKLSRPSKKLIASGSITSIAQHSTQRTTVTLAQSQKP